MWYLTLLILVHHDHMHVRADREVMMERCFRSHTIIKDIANAVIPYLPEAHALSACDTVSSSAAGSKATVF